jgi:glycosyltransferase involved in cell wall biosynthesis
VLNPSLGKNALSRDKIFLKITKLFRKKVIVFIHGWDLEHEKQIDTDPYKYFKSYFKVDIFLVLSSEFKLKLLEWGVTCDIRLTTTKVDDRLIAQFDASKRNFSELNFLFLSRIVKNKGVFEALDAFKELSKVFLGCKLNIVGDGSDLDDAKQYATSQNIVNVNFKGRLDGNDLIKEFISNNIYLFPSSHGEGMPTSVLEAMAFAMPIITTYNAGLKDFFEDGLMGYVCEMKSSQSLFIKTKKLIETEDLKCISEYNFQYAKSKFLASIVAPNLEKSFTSVY